MITDLLTEAARLLDQHGTPKHPEIQDIADQVQRHPDYPLLVKALMAIGAKSYSTDTHKMMNRRLEHDH